MPYTKHAIPLHTQTGTASFSLLEFDTPKKRAPVLHWAHATGFTAQTYEPLLTPLAKHIKIFASDARGHGQTYAPADPTKLKHWYGTRDDMIAMVEHIVAKTKCPIHLGGHSMGGCVSLLVATKRPDLVASLVLVDPVIVPRVSRFVFRIYRALTGNKTNIDLAEMAARRRALWNSIDAMEDSYRGRGAFTNWQDGFLRAYLESGTRPHPDGVALACTPAWEAAHFRAQKHNSVAPARACKKPFLLLCAEHGSTVRAPKAFHLAPAPKTIKTIKNSSHFLPMEFPETVQAEIQKFLLDR